MEDQIIEQEQVVETPEQVTPAATPPWPQADQNLNSMRKKLEAEERARKAEEKARKELERKLEELERQQVDQSSEPTYSNNDSKKLQELENKLAQLEAQSEIEKLKDFNDVVSDDNLATFARLYPEDYATLLANPNMKAKAKTAYNMIKNYGISSKGEVLKQAEKIAAAEKKIEANKSKPGTISAAASATPLSKFARYNEDGRLVLSEEDAARINADVRRKLTGSY